MICLFHLHRNDLTDSVVILGVDNRAMKTGQTIGPSVRSVVRAIGVSVWLALEPVFNVGRKGICLRTILEVVLMIPEFNRCYYASWITPLRTGLQQELMPLRAKILETLMQR